MRKKIIIGFSSLLTLLSLSVIVLLLWSNGVIDMFILSQDEIIKESITIDEANLREQPYIICKPVRTTGFDWLMVQDEDKNENIKYVIINGTDPMNELKAGYEFSVTPNRFIFYVVEKNERYSEMLYEHIEYVVDGWDILYPVSHGGIIYDLFGLHPRYIIQADLLSSP